MKRVVLVATLLLIGIGLVFFNELDVLSQPTGGIGGKPANPDPDIPRSQSIFIYTLDKGESKSDEVLVVNNSDQEQTIELYAVDGMVTNTGSYTCRQESEHRVGLGSWIDLSENEVVVGPAQSEKVSFTLTVPENADIGEHNGCFVFQVKDDEGEVSGNVRIRTRQAVRVVSTVPGDLHREISIDSFEVSQRTTEEKGYFQQYNLNLSNVGNVSADVETTIRLRGLFGRTAHENGGGYPVLANESLELTFTNQDLPMFGGWYIVEAAIAYDERAGTFGTDDEARLTTHSADRHITFIRPTSVGLTYIVSILTLAVIALTTYILRRRKLKKARTRWELYTVQSGDSLESIVSKTNVSWRTVAKVNKLKAPYNLKPGAKIRVPVSKSSASEKLQENKGTKDKQKTISKRK